MTDLRINGITLDVDLPTGGPVGDQPHGSYYLVTPDVTLIPAEGQWIKAAGATEEVHLKRFTTSQNRLTYTGDDPVHVHGAASFTAETVGAYKTVEYGIGLNGEILQHSVMARRHQSVDIGTGAVHFDTMMVKDDYVEFFVRNVIDGSNVKVTRLYVFCMGML